VAQNIRKKMLATRGRKTTVSLIAITLLLIGIYLVYDAIRPINPPDMQKADGTQIVQFLRGDYDRLSKSHQKKFIRNLGKWYLSTNKQDRKTLEQNWKNTDIARNIRAQIRVSSFNQLASKYASMSKEEKQKSIGQINLMVSIISGGKDTFSKWFTDGPWDSIIKNPVEYQQKMDPYQREMTLNTTAQERADFVKLCGDLAKYNGLRK